MAALETSSAGGWLQQLRGWLRHGPPTGREADAVQPTLNVRVYRDEVDGGWIAECVNLPGCVSDGATEREALDNVVEAIAAVIATRAGDELSAMESDDEDEGHELALVI